MLRQNLYKFIKNEHFYGKKAFEIKSNWSDFIQNIDFAYYKDFEEENKNDSYKRIGYLRFYREDCLKLVIDFAHEFPYKDLEKIRIFIKNNGLVPKEAIAFISLISNISIPRHRDLNDVFYVQFIGSVEWKIWTNNGDKTYKLSPGDFIFVPKNTEHQIRSISPRAAISFLL